MTDELIPSNQERICPKCGRKFVPTSQWAYKMNTKGKYIYLCRYNCHRAAERKLDNKTRGKKEMKSKRPSKEQLESDLRAGLSLAQIAKKHNSCDTSAYNWIKAYGIQGIKGEEKPKKEVTRIMPSMEEFAAVVFGPDVELTDELVETVNDMAQHSPSLAEIEQFHTDVEAQELPKVEMESVWSGFSPVKPIDLPGTLAGLDLSKVEPIGMTDEENMSDAEWDAQKPIEPTWTQDEWESKHKEEWEAKWEAESEPDQPIPQGTCEEVWQGVLDDLKSIRRVYLSEAERAFDERFRALCAEIWQ